MLRSNQVGSLSTSGVLDNVQQSILKDLFLKEWSRFDIIANVWRLYLCVGEIPEKNQAADTATVLLSHELASEMHENVLT